MLQINGKTFMNLQEAVQWLLDNNALPFQSSANYVANTEIGMGTIVNPSPAKVRIGSLIFFADSKVSTVIGLTENGFMVSDQYNDLVDDIVYVSNVAINASGHLIVTLSNGDNIDAGLIKQVTSFSIDGSQHLIANYNDGTSSDLGAIFNGNVTISGTLNATTLTATNAKIFENIQDSGGKNRFVEGSMSNELANVTLSYGRWSLSGSHLLIVFAGSISAGETISADSYISISQLLPLWIFNKIYPIKADYVIYESAFGIDSSWNGVDFRVALVKYADQLRIKKSGSTTFTNDTAFRVQFDLLIDNL